MAERDPNLPQSADPELQADLVRLLQVQGPLGILNVLDVVLPVVMMGQVVPLDVQVRQPSFRSTDVFSAGRFIAPPADQVFADTGSLAAGIYDVQYQYSALNSGTGESLVFQHRNAANDADLMQVVYMVGGGNINSLVVSIGYEIGSNERLRIKLNGAGSAGSAWSGIIFARRRA